MVKSNPKPVVMAKDSASTMLLSVQVALSDSAKIRKIELFDTMSIHSYEFPFNAEPNCVRSERHTQEKAGCSTLL